MQQTLAALSIRMIYQVLRELNGGTAGFNYAQFNKAQLIEFICGLDKKGERNFTDEQIDAAIKSAGQRAARPTLPGQAPALAPDVPTPSVAPVLPVAPVAIATPAPAPVAPLAPTHTAHHVTTSTVGIVAKRSATEIFGVPGLDDVICEVWNDPAAPEIDKGYVFDARILRFILPALNRNPARPCWAFGPKGCGKTEFFKNIAAYLRRSFHVIQFDRYTERAEIVGAKSVKGWEDGSLLAAYRTPGALVLLDEITYAQAGCIAVLNTILDIRSGSYRVPDTGELVPRADGVAIFAGDNTNGTGDSTGRYGGTNEFNSATLDRFMRFVEFSYLPEDVETALLVKRTGIDKPTARKIVKLLGICRTKVDEGELLDPPSFRAVMAFAECLIDGIPASEAFELTVACKTAAECREPLRQTFSAFWN